jgi:hypothetical protein
MISTPNSKAHNSLIDEEFIPPSPSYCVRCPVTKFHTDYNTTSLEMKKLNNFIVKNNINLENIEPVAVRTASPTPKQYSHIPVTEEFYTPTKDPKHSFMDGGFFSGFVSSIKHHTPSSPLKEIAPLSPKSTPNTTRRRHRLTEVDAMEIDPEFDEMDLQLKNIANNLHSSIRI